MVLTTWRGVRCVAAPLQLQEPAALFPPCPPKPLGRTPTPKDCESAERPSLLVSRQETGTQATPTTSSSTYEAFNDRYF